MTEAGVNDPRHGAVSARDEKVQTVATEAGVALSAGRTIVAKAAVRAGTKAEGHANTSAANAATAGNGAAALALKVANAAHPRATPKVGAVIEVGAVDAERCQARRMRCTRTTRASPR